MREYKGYDIDLPEYDGNSLNIIVDIWLNNKVVKSIIILGNMGKRLNGMIQARQWIDKQILLIND